MAYKRPLTSMQSIIIASLWVVFVWLYIRYARLDGMGVLVLGASAFIIFYPIVKSHQERQNQNKNK